MDTVYYHRALEAYRAASGDNRPTAELPLSVLSRILLDAEALKRTKASTEVEPIAEYERRTR